MVKLSKQPISKNLSFKISVLLKVINQEKSQLLHNIKALVFDWDGVFHAGHKKPNGETTFSEADSMGINMLRLAYYLNSNEIPKTIIISGENNPTAHFFATREHFDFVFTKAKDKKFLIDFLTQKYAIKATQIAFVFDDILDLSLAKKCGFRFLVKRKASKNLQKFIEHNNLTDFITTLNGGNHAIRQIAEYIIEEMDLTHKTYTTRIENNQIYQNYLASRNTINAQFIEIQ